MNTPEGEPLPGADERAAAGLDERRRLARAELMLRLASTAERWNEEVNDRDPHCRPFHEWPDDEPLRELTRTYDLSAEQLGAILHGLGDELEELAIRGGYDHHWDALAAWLVASSGTAHAYLPGALRSRCGRAKRPDQYRYVPDPARCSACARLERPVLPTDRSSTTV